MQRSVFTSLLFYIRRVHYVLCIIIFIVVVVIFSRINVRVRNLTLQVVYRRHRNGYRIVELTLMNWTTYTFMF